MTEDIVNFSTLYGLAVKINHIPIFAQINVTPNITQSEENKKKFNICTLALRDNEEFHNLKKKVVSEDHKWRTDGKKDKKVYLAAAKEAKKRKNTVLAAESEIQWKKTGEKICANPSHIFKLLHKAGKRAKRQSDRPYIEEDNNKITTDPERVKKVFHSAWSKIYGNVTTKKLAGEWLKHVKMMTLSSSAPPYIEICWTEKLVSFLLRQLQE